MDGTAKPGLQAKLVAAIKVRIFPALRRRRWMILRLALVGLLMVLLRYHVVAWLVRGHDLAWRTVTWRGAPPHPAAVERLLHLRGPGARMLVRMGEASALSSARDPEMIPALLDLASEHADPKTRAAALRGLSNFWDERIPPVLVESLGDPDREVRRVAVVALAELLPELDDERYVSALRDAARVERDPVLRQLFEYAVGMSSPGREAEGRVAGLRRAQSSRVKVAAVQFMSEFGDPERNRKRLSGFVREAAANGAKIVVLPEAAITGYMSADLKRTWADLGSEGGREVSEGLRGVSPAEVAETVPGPSSRAFCALAKELGIYLTVPFVEIEPATGRYFNTVVLAGPGGDVLLHYRKLNPWPFAERGWASAGDRGLGVTGSPYGRLGLLICYDINYEPGAMSKKGVDILLYCIAWVDAPKSRWFHVGLPGVARAEGFAIVGANWTVKGEPDWHGHGQSLVVDRSGRVLARASSDAAEEIVYAELPVVERRAVQAAGE